MKEIIDLAARRRAYQEKIEKIMSGNGLHGEVWSENDCIAVEISWGDWKHEHGLLDWLVSEQMPGLVKIGGCTTEEDGSDCYSAIHRFYFKFDSDAESSEVAVNG